MTTTRLSATILILGLCTFSIGHCQPALRILGGEEPANKEAYPHAASLRLDNAHVCGASIIGTKSILTAAHCVMENGKVISPKRLDARVGSLNKYSGGKLAYISQVIVNPNYNGLKNDVAILMLENDLTFTSRIKSIPLATLSSDLPPVDAKVMSGGWGDQAETGSASKLNVLAFTVANEAKCKDAYSDADESSFCLAHELQQGSCSGDAGNGAVYNGKLVGVSNFVVGACGSRYPDVFSNVVYFASWIESVIA